MTSRNAKRSAATLQDVAREVGVSKMAVSFALNGTGRISQEKRQAVTEAAQRLGYEPNLHARTLSHGRSNNTIGLFALWLDFGVGTRKIQIIQRLLNERGFDVPVYGVGLRNTKDEDAQATVIATIRRQKPRALVCATGRLSSRAVQELQRYQDEGGVLVCYDHGVEIDCDRVLFDREDNTYQATHHLLSMGHRKVGLGFHGFVDGNNPRLQGFKRALQEFGVELHPQWVLEGRENRDYAEGGVALANEYLRLKHRPSALCIVNDYAALSFMAEVGRAGVQCPRDVSIIGHDDHPLSRHYPVPLTTASHPSQTIAQHVTQLLLSRLDGEFNGPSRQIAVSGELIVRQSVQDQSVQELGTS